MITILLIIFTFASNSEACFPGGRLIRRMPKKETPLIFKQHIPNVPENSPVASGAREGRIRKFSKRFQELVVNYNPDIIFKDEEGTGEDRVMSMRCKEKLDALAMLVMNFWPGVKLRVTEAWDQQGHHSAESLHYEGRAVDITTSDHDRNKYGLLARLAAQAGFDWVYYESRMHVHASVKSDAVTRHKRILRCFPGNATVLSPDGDRKSMSQLRVGDKVAVLSANDHSPSFEPVIAFLHHNSNKEAEFLEIRTDKSYHRLLASLEHLIYVWENIDFLNSSVDSISTTNSKSSSSIRSKLTNQLVIGDKIIIFDSNASGVRLEKITSIRSIASRGVYAPLTPSGTIFVDDVLASCYAAVGNEQLAHAALAPLRFWYKIGGGLEFGSWTDGDGVHWYAGILWSVAEYLERWGINLIVDGV